MTFDWSEYFKLARELAGKDESPANEEARLRSSVSRAYFAAYCLARNYLIDKGYAIPSGPNGHRFVCNTLMESYDEESKKIGGHLNRLRIRRKLADYQDYVRGLSSMANDTLNLTREVISALRKIQ